MTLTRARRTFAATVSLAFAFALAAPAFAQTAAALSEIDGLIVDAQTGLALTDATVAVIDRDVTVTSDARGEFRLSSLQPGLYQLRVARSGYQPAESDTIALTAGSAATVTLALAAAPAARELTVIGRTSVKSGDALQRSSTTTRTLSTEVLAAAGVYRAGDALRLLPGINNGINGDTAALGDDLQLNLRGIGTLETTAMLDGHPIAYGFPGGYNYQVSPVFPFRSIGVTYGSGSNVVGQSAIGGIIDFQTLEPTQDRRFSFTQGYGTFDKAASALQASGSGGRFAYAFAYGASGLDGPIHDSAFYQPGAAYDVAAPAGSPVWALGVYRDDSSAVSHSGLAKLRYDLGPAGRLTFTALAGTYWNDKTGNGDGDYLDYGTALAQGNQQLAQANAAAATTPNPCPQGQFPGTNANGVPYGTGPNGLPDGGSLCQTPASYAAANAGFQGAGPAWQSFNLNDYHLGFESTPGRHDVRADVFTDRYLNTISRADALPAGTPGAFTVNWNEIETGATVTDTLLGANNDLGIGYTYLNLAYNLKFATYNPYSAAVGAPIVRETGFILHDAYHPHDSPLRAFADVRLMQASATKSSYVDPRLSIAYSASSRDLIRASAGATTTQPSGDMIGQPFVPSFNNGAGGGTAFTCGLNSIGNVPSSALKPERGVDAELAYGHRFRGDTQAQIVLYNVNVFDKLYNALFPLGRTGTSFIDPAYLAQTTATLASLAQSNGCAPGVAQPALNGWLNIGQLRARGLMFSGRTRFAKRTFVDYDWALDSTALLSAPDLLLEQNPTLIVGSQLQNPNVPLHKLNAALDQTIGEVEVRYGYHWISGGNTKHLPAYDFSDLLVAVAHGNSVLSVSVGNLFNQDASIQGLRYEGVPFALNQYATDYSKFGPAATEQFGLPYRTVQFNYTVHVR